MVVDPTEKRILATIYSLSVSKGGGAISDIALELGVPLTKIEDIIYDLEGNGLVLHQGLELELTEKGRKEIKVVLIGGAFEIIHPGHLYTIRESKRYGDVLVVVVATNKSVKKNKKRAEVTDEKSRVELVASLRDVDAAILGGEGSIYDTLEKVRPDIVAVGYDQKHRERDIVKEAKKRGIDLSVVRLGSPSPEIKTSKIVKGYA